MSTGVICSGRELGLSGEKCEEFAPAETGVCQGCCGEAEAAGRTIQKFSVLEQWQHAWSPDRELE